MSVENKKMEQEGRGRCYWFVGSNDEEDRFLTEECCRIYFTKEEKDERFLKLAQEIRGGDVLILKSTFTKGEKRKISCLRIKAVGVVQNCAFSETEDNLITCECKVQYINTEEKEFDGYGGYFCRIHKVKTKAVAIIVWCT